MTALTFTNEPSPGVAGGGWPTLTTAITDTTTATVLVTTTAPYPPSGQFTTLLDQEIMLASVAGPTSLSVTRGYEGSTPTTHLATGVPVYVILTAGALNSFGGGGSPSGSAGGDLGSTYPNPTVTGGTHFTTEVTTSQTLSGAGTGIDASKLQGTAPGTGLLIPYADLTGSPTSLPPSGAAGGDLGGSYPNPTVTSVPDSALSSNIPLLNAADTFTNTVTATALIPSGLTGAVAATRYVGRHDGSAPASGTFAVGDYIIDATTPAIWICTAAGTPGTWTKAGGSSSASSLVNSSATLALNADGSLAQTGAGSLTISATSVNANLTSVTFGSKSPLRMTIYIAVSAASVSANTLLFNIHFSSALASIPVGVSIQPFMDATATHTPVAGTYYLNTPTTSDLPVYCTAIQAINATYGIEVTLIL